MLQDQKLLIFHWLFKFYQKLVVQILGMVKQIDKTETYGKDFVEPLKYTEILAVIQGKRIDEELKNFKL